MDAIFAAIDVTAVAATIGTLGVAIVGINMAFKSIGLAKRAVKSV